MDLPAYSRAISGMLPKKGLSANDFEPFIVERRTPGIILVDQIVIVTEKAPNRCSKILNS
jgi:hypothetical protein